MAGYSGYSMSNNAVDAYKQGEMPLSKWSKKAILEGISDIREDAELFKRLTLAELKKYCLRLSSWHHTSKYYNKTDFYEIDEYFVLSFDENKANNIISARVNNNKKSSQRSKEEIAVKNRQKLERKYGKAAKSIKQNEYYCNDKPLRNCSDKELIEMINFYNTIYEEFNTFGYKNYKTIRSFVTNELKKIQK